MSTAMSPMPHRRQSFFAFTRMRAGGRLVAITGTGLSPENAKWRPAFERLQEQGTVIFTAAIDGHVYARHGTTTETRLTIIDKVPAADPKSFVRSPGKAKDVGTLLSWITDLPPRQRAAFRNRSVHCPAASCAMPPCTWVPERGREPHPSLSQWLLRRTSNRSVRLRGRSPLARSRQTARRRSPSPISYATGCRKRVAGSPTRSTNRTRSSRSTFPAQSRIRRRSCSRPQWPPSRHQNLPIGRFFLMRSSRTACVGRPARKRRPCRRSPLRPSRRHLDG